MNNIFLLNKLAITFLFLFFVIGCSDTGPGLPPPDYGAGNTIFAQTTLINTIKPAFNETASSTPAFVWQATGQKYVFLGIFSERIIAKNNIIENINKNIWAWHSGLGRGREGSVYFSDGFDVVSGELDQNRSPTPLLSGEYYWAVWAWAYDGIKVTYSSQEMYFIVE